MTNSPENLYGTASTKTVQDFIENYPYLNTIYFNRIVEIEAIAEKGRQLYEEYYSKKVATNIKDRELAIQGRQMLQRAIDRIYPDFYEETKAHSLLRLYREISDYAQDLAKELEPDINFAEPTSK
ncbi:MAG: hypothetical protein ABIH42_03895 [Planctomycetota bacterium]